MAQTASVASIASFDPSKHQQSRGVAEMFLLVDLRRALRALEARDFDRILCDVGLPDTPGTTLFDRVIDHRPDLGEDERLDLLQRRARVARFGIDLALRTARSTESPPPTSPTSTSALSGHSLT